MRALAISNLLFVAFCTVGSYADTGVDAVNRLRVAAGLPQLAPAAELAEAAQGHAAYLDRHRDPGKPALGVSAHQQQAGLPGFSGESPAARALAAGYPHREVLENVSMGYADMADALDGLMSAIYHRLTFLDLRADEMGVAVGVRSRVFMLGRRDLRHVCGDSPPAEALFRTPVDCLGQAMTQTHYQALCAELPDDALFQSSHAVSCPNGQRLDAAFMASVCRQPPAEARFGGHGRYYEPCGEDTRIAARWFDAICDDPASPPRYAASGQYYEICEPPRQVYAEWLEAQCAALPPAALYTDSGRYRRPCARPSDIRVEFLDAMDRRKRLELPAIVVWPPAGAGEIPPAFFVEEPDPLPDRAVSGFPVSIQVNPAFAGQVALTRFALFRIAGDRRVAIDDVRVLDADNDPNQVLSKHEFALFPLQRLAWGTDYEVEAELILDDQPRQLAWRFTTQRSDIPVKVAGQDSNRFSVRSQEPFLLVVPPREGTPHTVLQSRIEHLRGNRVDLEVVDPNTVKVLVDIVRCDRIKIRFGEGPLVQLVPEGCPR